MKNIHRSCAALLILLATGCSSSPSSPSSDTAEGMSASGPRAARQQLSGHLTLEMARATVIDRVPAATAMNLVVGLPVRDRQALWAAVEKVSDPASASYGLYLTPAEFGEAYGASHEDYQSVLDWARSHNLEVTAHANRLVVEVRGAAADVEEALHLRLQVARRSDGSLFRMPDAEPSLDLDVPIEHIGNLDDYLVPQPLAGSAANGAYQGSDFRNAYASCTSLTGAGQSIGIIGFQGFTQSDIDAYFASTSLPKPSALQTMPSGSVPAVGVEGTVDPEQALSMAPGAQVVIFTGDLDTQLTNMAARSDVKQVSSSYLLGVSSTGQNLLAQMAMQGQSFFQGSGDSGANAPGTTLGASDSRLMPTVTDVGGTALSMNGSGVSYGTETAWSCSTGNNTCSGGGVLVGTAIPSYQANLATFLNGGSSTYRNFPDVSTNAAAVSYYVNGSWAVGAGTSASAPLMAGFTALVNQLRASQGLPSVGAPNPALYAAAKASYGTSFNDITQGGNVYYQAMAGYDLVTGLGAPQCGLITALAGVAPPPSCVAATSCAGIIGAPPDLIVTCPTAVDFYGEDLNGNRSTTLLQTSSTMTVAEGDYATYLFACTHGTTSCLQFSEYAPIPSWCPASTGTGDAGAPSCGTPRKCCMEAGGYWVDGTCQ